MMKGVNQYQIGYAPAVKWQALRISHNVEPRGLCQVEANHPRDMVLQPSDPPADLKRDAGNETGPDLSEPRFIYCPERGFPSPRPQLRFQDLK